MITRLSCARMYSVKIAAPDSRMNGRTACVSLTDGCDITVIVTRRMASRNKAEIVSGSEPLSDSAPPENDLYFKQLDDSFISRRWRAIPKTSVSK